MLNNISSLRITSPQSSDLWIEDTNSFSNEYESSFFGIEATTQVIEADRTLKYAISYLRKHCEPRLITLMHNCSFEPNEPNDAILFFKQICDKYGSLAASQMLVHMYNTNLENKKILSSILYIVIYFEDIFSSTGITMALASISNSSNEIRELSVRVFENYCTKDSYNALCSLKKQEPWLQSYIDCIKKDFKKRLCL